MGEREVAIIGAGPAGLCAGIYLRRAGFTVTIWEKDVQPGGQMLLTDRIENYPGFDSISGLSLAEKFRTQAIGAGCRLLSDRITAIKNTTLTFPDGETKSYAAVLIAAGAESRKLNIPGEAELIGRGVSYCATCDGAFFRGKNVLVIGGGDSAVQEALLLSSLCRHVTLIHRRKTLRAEPIRQEALWEKENIEFLPEEEAAAFVGDHILRKVLCKSGRQLPVDGAFIAIGRTPNTAFLPPEISLDEQGYILTDADCRTSVPGVYAAGDIRSGACRQIVAAAADGARAAQAIAAGQLSHSIG